MRHGHIPASARNTKVVLSDDVSYFLPGAYYGVYSILIVGNTYTVP